MAEEMGNSNYLRALKDRNLKPVEMKVSNNRQAVLDQKNKCIKCNKVLKPYLYNFVANPATKKVEVVCADCTIQIKHR
ncbi:MAG: hypothetical protein AABW50_04350 [Nanoarchaeota archaeon]